MKIDEEDSVTDLIKAIVDLSLIIANLIYSVFLIVWLWDWFVVPLGVIKINFPWALGLSILASIIMGDNQEIESGKENKEKRYLQVRALIVKTLALITAYLAYLSL